MMVKLLTLIFVATAIFWFVLARDPNQTAGLYLQFILFMIPFIGAIVGFYHARCWGGMQSAMGKAVGFISAGTFAWALGMLIWNYYIFISQVEIPYPSIADAAFILSWPLWTIGVLYLSKATGVKFALRELRGKILLVVVPIIAIALSYYLIISVARGGVFEIDATNVWKLFFDMFYPIGSAVIFTITLTFFSLSTEFLGGKYRMSIIVLIFAFLVNFIADITFSYTTTNGTYFNGAVADMLFVTGMYLFALSLALMTPRHDAVREIGVQT